MTKQNLNFDQNRFKLKFSSNDENGETNYILFSKNDDYCITSMKCYLKVESKIKELCKKKKKKKNYDIDNYVIANGIDHLYRFNKVVYTIDTRGYENKKAVST